MKIIYHCYGGSHSSVTAAAIHLGLLTEKKVPSPEELQKLPYYDGQVNKDHGLLRFMGIDQYNNQVYIIGRRNSGRILENVYRGLMEIFRIPRDEVYMFSVMPYVNWRMVVGGYISRRLGLVKIGRPLVTKGTRVAFLNLVSMVQKVKILVASIKTKG